MESVAVYSWRVFFLSCSFSICNTPTDQKHFNYWALKKPWSRGVLGQGERHHENEPSLPLWSKIREIREIPKSPFPPLSLFLHVKYEKHLKWKGVPFPFPFFYSNKAEYRLCMWADTLYSFPTGEHLYCGLWRCRPYLLSRPLCGIWLHLFWHHPQWHAHLHSVQQVFRLLRQTEGAGIQRFKHRAHLPAQETSEAQVWQLLRTPARGIWWWDTLSAQRKANYPRERGLSKAANSWPR